MCRGPVVVESDELAPAVSAPDGRRPVIEERLLEDERQVDWLRGLGDLHRELDGHLPFRGSEVDLVSGVGEPAGEGLQLRCPTVATVAAATDRPVRAAHSILGMPRRPGRPREASRA